MRGRADERSATDILTSDLTSLPPSCPPVLQAGPWLWEFVFRYSGATVADFHGVPRHCAAFEANRRFAVSKNIHFVSRRASLAKEND